MNELACGTKFWGISVLDELEECGCVIAVSFPLQKQNKAYKGKQRGLMKWRHKRVLHETKPFIGTVGTPRGH